MPSSGASGCGRRSQGPDNSGCRVYQERGFRDYRVVHALRREGLDGGYT